MQYLHDALQMNSSQAVEAISLYVYKTHFYYLKKTAGGGKLKIYKVLLTYYIFFYNSIT